MRKIPKLLFQGVMQNDFEQAVDVLESCLKHYAVSGHDAPFFSPGGEYGECWWSLDEALALSGYKWIDRTLTERVFLNLAATQKPDGRILLWGNDFVPHVGIQNQQSEVSSLPKFFEVGITLCRQSVSRSFVSTVYDMFRNNLQWWFESRQDKETKLISALFEETFLPYLGDVFEYAPMDTNILIACACGYTAELSNVLGMKKDAEYYTTKKAEILSAVNEYMWDAADCTYYPYLLKEKKLKKLRMASVFSGFVSAKGDLSKTQSLLALLKDDSHFNWNTIPLTSVSKQDKAFRVSTGAYEGNPSWSGSVWTLLNEGAIRGLLLAGEDRTAADLALKTVKAFNRNYCEFLNPFDGMGHGVPKYAWSAAQYMQIIIDYIFGVDYLAAKDELVVKPLLSEELRTETMSLKGLALPNGKYANIVVDYTGNDVESSIEVF